MLFKRYFQESRQKWTMLGLGVLVGLLAMWLIFKALTPVVKKVCTYILETDEDKAFSRQNRVATVEASVIQLGSMTKRIATVGRLKANADVMLRSEMNGKIKEIAFTEGTNVEEGSILLKFEDSDMQAELKQAGAELILKKADFERASKLHEQKIGSLKEYDKARAELAVAEGRVDSAQAKLDKTIIKAPFSGTIGLINVSVGAYVQAAQDLVRIVDSTPIKVEFKVPEKYIHDIGVGQTVEIRIDAFKNKVFQGTVDAVDAQVEAESHSISLKAAIPNEEGLLKAGLFANLSLITGEKGETIVVDEGCVDREGEIEFVWIVEKGKASRRRVLTGTRENGQIEIVAGLRPSQIVVTSGQLKLGDGVRVKITNMPEPGSTPKEEQKAENPSSETTDNKSGAPSESKPEEVKKSDSQNPENPNASVIEEKKDQSQESEKKPEDNKPSQAVSSPPAPVAPPSNEISPEPKTAAPAA